MRGSARSAVRVSLGPEEGGIVAIARGETPERALANACLIAAAPELLAALETLVYHEVNISGPARVGVHQARVAIRKAKGE